MSHKDRVNLAERLRHEVGRLQPDPFGLGEAKSLQITSDPQKSTVIFPSVTVTCLTDACQLSSPDSVEPHTLHNYVLLRHSLRFAPVDGAGFTSYTFAARAIGKQGQLGDLIPEFQSNGDQFQQVFASNIVSDCVLNSSKPGETVTLVNHHETCSMEFGIEVGFSAEGPEIGLSAGYSLTDERTWNVRSVSCSDHSTNRVLKVFNMNTEDQQKAPFEIVCTEIFQLPAKDYDQGSNMRFEVGVAATANTGVTYANVTRQIFEVAAPPPPPPKK